MYLLSRRFSVLKITIPCCGYSINCSKKSKPQSLWPHVTHPLRFMSYLILFFSLFLAQLNLKRLTSYIFAVDTWHLPN